MKTRTLQIAILTILATATPVALAQDASFPDVGRSYDIAWAQDGKLADGKIKVIRKTDGPWIFVEYTYMKYVPGPPAAPGSQVPRVVPAPVTKQLWVNTRWIVTASELEPEKK